LPAASGLNLTAAALSFTDCNSFIAAHRNHHRRRSLLRLSFPLGSTHHVFLPISLRISTFTTLSVPSIAMVFYALLYLAIALVVAIRRFSQRDL
jgi:hypothetical protein